MASWRITAPEPTKAERLDRAALKVGDMADDALVADEI